MQREQNFLQSVQSLDIDIFIMQHNSTFYYSKINSGSY